MRVKTLHSGRVGGVGTHEREEAVKQERVGGDEERVESEPLVRARAKMAELNASN